MESWDPPGRRHFRAVPRRDAQGLAVVERLGNAIYGQYGQDFTSNDGVAFMIVTLTKRHFQDLVEVSGTGAAISALADSLRADFTDEGVRYRYREVLSGLFADVVR